MLIEEISKLVEAAVKQYLAAENLAHLNFTIEIERPPSPEFGDFATNIALQLTSQLGKPPLTIAQEIIDNLQYNGIIDKAAAAPPGFINLTISPKSLPQVLYNIADQGEQFGQLNLGQGQTALVEFVSANPTGPLHIGHARNAVFGDTLGRVLQAAGYKVTREYYFNDAGSQMLKLGQSLQARYLQLQSKSAEIPADGYQGEYLIEIAEKLKTQFGKNLEDTKDVEFFTQFAVQEILESINEDLEALGIHFDNWVTESELHRQGKVDQVIEELKQKDSVYLSDGAWWLKTTEHGDEKDRVLVKSDGEKTYFAPDIAYHKDKYQRGFDLLINIFGGDHHGYVPRLKAGVKSLGYDSNKLHCLIIQMVTLLKEKERLKLSTRSGEFITLKQMIQELGRDVVRFFFLTRSADSHLVFDWALAKDTSMDNPVYYIQYAYARFSSIFKKAEEQGITWRGIKNSELSLLQLPEEQELIKQMSLFPEIIKRAAMKLEPHYLTSYLQELTATFHQYYTMGMKNKQYRVIIGTEPVMTQARLSLIHCLRVVVGNALNILGISAPERM